MVAKQTSIMGILFDRYLLAKIHMVAKQSKPPHQSAMCYLLAKIHMVAKLNRLTIE